MSAQEDHGPHGGTWVKTSDGWIEISVFETNVPPRFRLYHFDERKRPENASSDEITLETVRPGGSKQLFTFTPHGNFLESNADIAEPHDFEVNLNATRKGRSHLYKTR